MRRSQFIRTYGPGSLISYGSSSGVMLELSRAELGNIDLNDYDITDNILSDVISWILEQWFGQNLRNRRIRVFEIPGSQERNRPAFTVPVKYFPSWHLCMNREHRYPVLHRNLECPECHSRNPNPVRYIIVCPYGHMDDVPWNEVVHRFRHNCSSNAFDWIPSGSDIIIRCRSCDSRIRLRDIYRFIENGRLRCTGRIPEREQPGSYTHVTEPCPPPDTDNSQNNTGEEMRPQLLLRNASNVKINEVITIFAAWPRATAEHHYFLRYEDVLSQVLRFYERECEATSENLRHILENEPSRFLQEIFSYIYVDREMKEREFRELFQNNGLLDADKLVRVIEDIREYRERFREGIQTFGDVLGLEFENLIMGMTEGIPPQELRRGRTYIEMAPWSGQRYGNLYLEPVDKLTVYQILVGYRRVNPVAGRFMSAGWERGQSIWFPAMVLAGEGIFITFTGPQGHGIFELRNSEAVCRWLNVYNSVRYEEMTAVYRPGLFRNGITDPDELYPGFVFLHTLSHLIIRALGALSGYSSTSIRERIYVFPDSENPLLVRGGILLYSAGEDEDGALGGLTSLCRKQEAIQKLMNYVIEYAYSCSNNPVCEETRFEAGNYGGAACHACVTVSETSCEHRNMWLDRHILIENIHLITGSD